MDIVVSIDPPGTPLTIPMYDKYYVHDHPKIFLSSLDKYLKYTDNDNNKKNLCTQLNFYLRFFLDNMNNKNAMLYKQIIIKLCVYIKNLLFKTNTIYEFIKDIRTSEYDSSISYYTRRLFEYHMDYSNKEDGKIYVEQLNLPLYTDPQLLHCRNVLLKELSCVYINSRPTNISYFFNSGLFPFLDQIFLHVSNTDIFDSEIILKIFFYIRDMFYPGHTIPILLERLGKAYDAFPKFKTVILNIYNGVFSNIKVDINKLFLEHPIIHTPSNMEDMILDSRSKFENSLNYDLFKEIHSGNYNTIILSSFIKDTIIPYIESLFTRYVSEEHQFLNSIIAKKILCYIKKIILPNSTDNEFIQQFKDEYFGAKKLERIKELFKENIIDRIRELFKENNHGLNIPNHPDIDIEPEVDNQLDVDYQPVKIEQILQSHRQLFLIELNKLDATDEQTVSSLFFSLKKYLYFLHKYNNNKNPIYKQIIVKIFYHIKRILYPDLSDRHFIEKLCFDYNFDYNFTNTYDFSIIKYIKEALDISPSEHHFEKLIHSLDNIKYSEDIKDKKTKFLDKYFLLDNDSSKEHIEDFMKNEVYKYISSLHDDANKQANLKESYNEDMIKIFSSIKKSLYPDMSNQTFIEKLQSDYNFNTLTTESISKISEPLEINLQGGSTKKSKINNLENITSKKKGSKKKGSKK